MLHRKSGPSAKSTDKTRHTHRVPHDADNPFTFVSNQLIDDNTIALETLGFLVWWLRQVDHWELDRGYVRETRHVGERGMRRIIAEAEQAGYLRRRQRRKGKGWFDEAQYDLFEDPRQESPETSTLSPSRRNVVTEEVPDLQWETDTGREEHPVESTSAPWRRNVRTEEVHISAEHPDIDVEETPVESTPAPSRRFPHDGKRPNGKRRDIVRTETKQGLNASNYGRAKDSADVRLPLPEESAAKWSEETFQRWWSEYPRKESIGSARKAFTRALQKTSVEILVAAATRYAAERRNEPPKFTKGPARWLDDECWLDQRPAAQGAGAPTIDQDGNVIAFDPAVSQSRPRSTAHEAAARIGAEWTARKARRDAGDWS